jgi:hypothetical protein
VVVLAESSAVSAIRRTPAKVWIPKRELRRLQRKIARLKTANGRMRKAVMLAVGREMDVAMLRKALAFVVGVLDEVMESRRGAWTVEEVHRLMVIRAMVGLKSRKAKGSAEDHSDEVPGMLPYYVPNAAKTAGKARPKGDS